MRKAVQIQIVGAPIGACGGSIKDAWRDAAGLVKTRLQETFGPAVEVAYYDLLDSGCPPLPAGVQLPLVLLDGAVFSSGGKLSSPALRRHLEEMGLGREAETLEVSLD